ncbi:MAG: DNA methylase [Bacteroidales bacterium]|nr:DNA methylase [Bacteroidales bacterium]
MSCYIAIDLKSFYASVECVERGLNPLTTNLVVADVSRTDKTICLAVSPALKAYGISGRARLFEVIHCLNEVNRDRLYHSPEGIIRGKSVNDIELKEHPELEVDFIAAKPRMAYYMDYSARIYNIYLRYVAPEDIHVYSIDEVFIDVTNYLDTYRCTPHELAIRMIRDVLRETGITATAGIGTNLYLCKVAMDIVAKHIPADADGVRIAELDEMEYRRQLWSHTPLTDFWRVGRGIARKLQSHGMYTMGDVAHRSLTDEESLYKLFGVNAELLIDHAWGWEPCTMAQIKAYRPETNSLSTSQVLQEPYTFTKARVVAREMAEAVALGMVDKHLVADQLTLTVGYDRENPRADKNQMVLDWYGRQVPRPAHGSAHLPQPTSSSRLIIDAVMDIFDCTVDPQLMVRRLTIGTYHVVPENAVIQDRQLDLFADNEAMEQQRLEEQNLRQRERRVQEATLKIKKKFGKNALLRGTDFEEGATARERNRQIGGHNA